MNINLSIVEVSQEESAPCAVDRACAHDVVTIQHIRLVARVLDKLKLLGSVRNLPPH